MKRTHLTRLQNSDVFSVPPSLGLKALRQNSITYAGLEMFGLHPLSSHYAQNTIGETLVFMDWVTKVLQINGALPRRSCWNAAIRNWERLQKEESSKFKGIEPQLVRNPLSTPSKFSVMVSPTMRLMSAHVDAFMAKYPDNGR